MPTPSEPETNKTGAPVETVRSFVNTWECDENDHLNVQFYMAHKDTADAQFRVALGLSPFNAENGQVRIKTAMDHVRFHKELRSADSIIVRSAVADETERTAIVFHELRNADTDELCATFRTRWVSVDSEGQPSAWPERVHMTLEELKISVPDSAKARSVDDDKKLPDINLREAGARGFAPTYAGIVPMDHCNAVGHFTARGLMACFSNAAAHFWTSAGMPFDKIRRNNLGTVALEDLLIYGKPLHAGNVIKMRSTVRSIGRKTVGFSHFVFDAESGVLAASADVTAALMDLKTRSTIELGEELTAGLRKASNSLN